MTDGGDRELATQAIPFTDFPLEEVSRVAGETFGAAAHLPTMATDEFLSCLSRQALERSATADGVKVEIRVKDTRAALVKHFDGKTWHFPGALFPLTEDERANAAARTGHWVSGSTAAAGGAGGGDLEEGSGEPDSLEGSEPGDQSDDGPNHYAVAAE